INSRVLDTGPANFGPEMATSAVAAFGPAGSMFVTLNVSGNFPSRYAFLRSWSATWPSPGLMPFSTRLILVVYDTPGSVTWLHRFADWSGVGRPCAALGGATAVMPAAAPPMTANAPTLVTTDF